MEKYEEFKNIKLEDTGLFEGINDIVLKNLKANKIYNLQDLFNLQTSNLKLCTSGVCDQIRGIICLAKYKYLKQDLPFLHVLEGTIVKDRSQNKIYLDNKCHKTVLEKRLVEMGFKTSFVNQVQWSFNSSDKLIDCLRELKNTSFMFEEEKNSTLKKINLIEQWYEQEVLAKYHKASLKYEDFKDINLEDTGLIRTNRLDFVYTCMRKNNITNLQELFAKDDCNMIDYNTTLSYAVINEPVNQIRGTISLLRYKYLKDNCPFIEIVNTKIHNGYVEINGKVCNGGLSDCFTRLGLPYEFSASLDRNAQKIGDFGFTGKLINYLDNFYTNRTGTIYCKSRQEYDNAIAKIEIILDWYKSLDPTYKIIDSVEEAKSMLSALYEELNALKKQKLDIDGKIHKTEKDIRYTDAVLRRLLKK